MKRMLAMLMALCMLVLIVACAPPEHIHTETETWEADSTGHWKVCEECGEKTQTGDHTLNEEAICTVCAADILKWDDSVSVYIYDKHENIIRMADYDTGGKLISEIVNEYAYDANGCLTKGKEYVDGQLGGETEYTVSDGESILAKYTNYNDDGSKFVNEYDIYGNVVTLTSYDENGDVSLQMDSQYAKGADGQWYEAACTETYSDGMKIKAEYNEHGSNTSKVIYDAAGNITSTENWEYTYDGDGNTATEKAYADGVLITETIYSIFIANDEMYSYIETVISYHEDGSKTVFKFNEKDELVGETKYDAFGKVME